MCIRDSLKNDLRPVPTSELGKAQRFDESGARYIEFCKSTVPAEVSFRSLRIIVDCANGACYRVTPAIFRELGAEVIEIGTEPDGFNINQDCGSTNPEKLKEEVLKQRADFGIAMDGDGDRVVIIDSKGNILDGDDILYILASSNPTRSDEWGGIVGTKMSNFGLEEALNELGYKFERAEVGDKYVSEMLVKKGWLLGGESSGHIICRDLVSTGDGTIAALKTISSLLILNKDAEEVLKGYKKMPQVLKSIAVKNKDILNDAELQKKIKKIESELIVGRVLARASGTENVIRIMVESESKETAEKYVRDISSFFENESYS